MCEDKCSQIWRLNCKESLSYFTTGRNTVYKMNVLKNDNICESENTNMQKYENRKHIF